MITTTHFERNLAYSFCDMTSVRIVMCVHFGPVECAPGCFTSKQHLVCLCVFLSTVLKRQVSPEELQSPGGPFLKKTFTVRGHPAELQQRPLWCGCCSFTLLWKMHGFAETQAQGTHVICWCVHVQAPNKNQTDNFSLNNTRI